VLAAAFVAALLVALAAAAEPFVTTAAASSALKTQLSQLTPLATGLQIRDELATYAIPRQADSLAQAQKREAAVERLAGSLPFVGRLDVADLSPQRGDSDRQGGITAQTEGGTAAIRLVARAGALAHVKILAQTSGPGVWIDEITEKALGVKPGGSFRLGGEPGLSGNAQGVVSLRVKGVYRPLAYETQSPYWINFFQDIYPQSLDASPPPSFAFVSRPTFFGILTKLGGGDFDEVFQLPVDPRGLTLQDARGLVRRFAAVNHTIEHTGSGLPQVLGCTRQELPSPGAILGAPASCAALSSLSAAVVLADENVSAVSPAITLLTGAGIAIALAAAVAAGVFLVRRRRAESALLFARGEAATTFAARTATEAFLPTLVGGAIGFALAFGLTGVFAPAGSTDNGTLESALAHAGIAVAVGLALLTLTASVAFLRLFDTGSRQLPLLRFLPWEIPLLVVALLLLHQVQSGGGLAGSGTSGTHHPTLAVFIFPLLLVAGVAGLAARVARWLLRARSGRRVRALPPALYLALRRLAAARGVLVTLAVVSSVAFGAFFYAETLAASLGKTTNEKAYIASGSDVSGQIQSATPLPRAFPYPITKLQYSNEDGALGNSVGTEADVMTVDPSSLARTLHWSSDWGPNPSTFLPRLAGSSSLPLPVIVTTDISATTKAIWIQGVRFPVRILARVKVFPGMSEGVPLVITSVRALNAASTKLHLFDPLDVPATYIWVKGPPAAIEQAFGRTSLQPYYVVSVDTYRKNSDFLLATRTLSYMRIVAIASGILVLIGLLLYLQARQRPQAIASALARRMGLRRRTEILSLSLELGAIVFFAATLGAVIAIAAAEPITKHLDPLPEYPPSPVFAIPTAVILVSVGALVVLSVAAGALTSWFAGRTDISEALRVA
jgi:putative ABC transport system permease protein